MAAKNLDHIGIVTGDIANIKKIIELLELEFIIEGESCGTKCAFYKARDVILEFIEPTTNESVRRFLEKNGELKLHHIAFKVDDLKKSVEHFKKKGQIVTFENEKSADGKSRIAFLHPKTTGGLLIELVE